jgi:hypothetical protein
MKSKKTIAIFILIGLLLISNIAMAKGGNENTVKVFINGVEVTSPANHLISGKTYVDVQAYSNLVGASFQTGQNTVNINGKQLSVKVINGTPTVHVRGIAEATNAEQISWDADTRTVYVLDLPEGVSSYESEDPGVGQRWANQKDLPFGPIYVTHQGKLIYIDHQIPLEGLENKQSWSAITGMGGLPTPSIDHTDIQIQPDGHLGYLYVPHYDIRYYFISHEEHLKLDNPEKYNIQWIHPMPETDIETISHKTYHSELMDLDIGYTVYLPPGMNLLRKIIQSFIISMEKVEMKHQVFS